MDKYMIHLLPDGEYVGIVTILDYEIRLKSYMTKLAFPSSQQGKKAIIDLALKTGMDRYRFLAVDLDSSGKVVWNTNNYVHLSEEMERRANSYLREHVDLVNNSSLSFNQKQLIMN